MFVTCKEAWLCKNFELLTWKSLLIFFPMFSMCFSLYFLPFSLKKWINTMTMNLSQINRSSGHVLRKIAILNNIFSTLPGHSKLLGGQNLPLNTLRWSILLQTIKIFLCVEEVTNGSNKKWNKKIWHPNVPIHCQNLSWKNFKFWQLCACLYCDMFSLWMYLICVFVIH